MLLGIVLQLFTSINRSSVDFSISNALRTAYIATQHIDNQDFTPSGSQFTNGFSIFNYNFTQQV